MRQSFGQFWDNVTQPPSRSNYLDGRGSKGKNKLDKAEFNHTGPRGIFTKQ